MSGPALGTLEDGRLIQVLRSISSAEGSGLLSVQGEQDLVSITFRSGSIVSADAMNHSAEEGLGEVLASEGVLSPAEFRAATTRSAEQGLLTSEVLRQGGLIDKRQLLLAVREQTYRQVQRVLRWRSGNFEWTPDVESSYQQGVDPISLAELLLRASDDLADGPLTGPVPELDDVFERVDEVETELKVLGVDDEGGSENPDVVWITPDEKRMLGALGSEQPASLLLLQCDLAPQSVKYGLHHLLALRLIRRKGRVSSDSPLLNEIQRGVQSDLQKSLDTPASESSSAMVAPSRGLDVGDDPLGLGRLELGDETPEGSVFDAPSQPSQRDSLLQPKPAPASLLSRRREPLFVLILSWTARAMALGLIALFLLSLALPRTRHAVLLPYPWLEGERAALARYQRVNAYGKIDQAIRTYHLVFGRHPEDLGLLVDLDLLMTADLYDPAGNWLDYSADESGYLLQPLEGARGLPGFEVSETVSSDFLLNSRFSGQEMSVSTGPAVVLLD